MDAFLPHARSACTGGNRHLGGGHNTLTGGAKALRCRVLSLHPQDNQPKGATGWRSVLNKDLRSHISADPQSTEKQAPSGPLNGKAPTPQSSDSTPTDLTGSLQAGQLPSHLLTEVSPQVRPLPRWVTRKLVCLFFPWKVLSSRKP